MNSGKTVFAQLVEHIPSHEFRKCVKRYRGNYKVKSFSCWDQFLCMAFAQLTYRESLRDVEACLRAMQPRLYHMGIRGRISKSTLSDANEKRDWHIYADFAQVLIHEARSLYANDAFMLELEETIYALDSTTIDLCLSLFPWAHFRKRKAAVKLHTLLDLRCNIPTFIEITEGRVHDVNILDYLVPEAGSFYVMDRAYLDFQRLHQLHLELAYFIIRAKTNLQFTRMYSRPVDKAVGLQVDQTIKLKGFYPSKFYPEKIRRIKFYDIEKDKHLTFLTNNFLIPALAVAKAYKLRWQIELFFKWIKQHLRIKSFFGTSENAVKTQIWIAVCVYILVAIVKKRLNLSASLYTILQILSVSAFEKTDIIQLFNNTLSQTDTRLDSNQLNLFD
jgi:hypothetical protein